MMGLTYKEYTNHQMVRDLWIFSGLYQEIASFLVAQMIGWDIVPPTVKTDGPFGIGSLQLFIPCDLKSITFICLKTKNHEALRVYVYLTLSPTAQTEKVVIVFERVMERFGV